MWYATRLDAERPDGHNTVSGDYGEIIEHGGEHGYRAFGTPMHDIVGRVRYWMRGFSTSPDYFPPIPSAARKSASARK